MCVCVDCVRPRSLARVRPCPRPFRVRGCACDACLSCCEARPESRSQHVCQCRWGHSPRPVACPLRPRPLSAATIQDMPLLNPDAAEWTSRVDARVAPDVCECRTLNGIAAGAVAACQKGWYGAGLGGIQTAYGHSAALCWPAMESEIWKCTTETCRWRRRSCPGDMCGQQRSELAHEHTVC